LNLNTVRAKENSQIHLLGVSQPLKWKPSSTGIEIELGDQIRSQVKEVNQLAYAFRIQAS
jgi:hypothetical protein